MAQTLSLPQGQMEIIRMVGDIDDVNVVEKIKKYIQRLTTRKEDSLYSPENIAAIRESEEQYQRGEYVTMDSEELHKFLFS